MIGFEPATPDQWVVDQAVLAVLEQWPGSMPISWRSSWRDADLRELVEFIVDAAWKAAA